LDNDVQNLSGGEL